MTQTNHPPELPSIKNIVEELYPCVFKLASKGQPLVEIFAHGRVKLHGIDNDDAAKLFWNAVAHYVTTEGREAMLIRDLTFLLTFIQGKGVIFCNPNEKVELAAWCGQIERRYGIGQN